MWQCHYSCMFRLGFIKILCLSQLYIVYGFILGLFSILFFITYLSDSFRLPFDYIECESELVTGLCTEFSGLLFICFSLFETNHSLFGMRA